jgi:DNA-binding Lrp family transcriptional regulator
MIDKIDFRILYELERNSRISETKLAKLVNRSKESVRYRINKLEQEKIISGFTIWIDPTKLGYQTAKIYLTLANIPDKKKEFIEYVKKDKRLFWLGIADGAWNAGLTFFVKSNKEFFDLKNEIFSKYKDLIIESKTASLVSAHWKNKSFLYSEELHWESMFDSTENIELDDVSKYILKELYLNSRENIVAIANKYHTSVDIIKNRLTKLNEKKIIRKYLAVIDYSKLGYDLFKTFVYFKDLNELELNALLYYAEQQPNLIHIVKQISPWDIEFEILCKGYREYNEIIASITQKFAKIINKVETAILSEDYIFPSEKMVFE